MQSMDKCGWVKSRCFLADFQARHTFRDVQSERRRPKRLHTQVGCVTRRIRAAESPWRPWTPDAPSILGMPCDPRSVALPVCLRCPFHPHVLGFSPFTGHLSLLSDTGRNIPSIILPDIPGWMAQIFRPSQIHEARETREEQLDGRCRAGSRW